MRYRLLWVLAFLVPLALVNGCSSTAEKTGASVVEDKGTGGLSGDELNANGAQSAGAGDSAGFEGSALDDPNSPLSQRVIYFDYDSSEVPTQYQSVVEAHAGYLAQHPDIFVTVEGHTDDRGSREYNLALGERRAIAVRRQLVLLGASAGQIKTVSYGEERPAVEGEEESAWAKNRRAELQY